MDTQATQPALAPPLPLPRKVLIAGLCCAGALALMGATGRFFLVLPLLLFGPGYLLGRWLAAAMEPVPLVRPVLWLALSLSSISVLYTWTTFAGLPLTAPVLQAGALFCGLLVLLAVWRDTGSPHVPPVVSIHAPLHVALLMVFACALGIRFVQIDGLAFPPWVDSVHHALLIRVVVEQGQAPYTLRPYLPIDQLPYHWGYHAFMASVLHVSGLQLTRVMLWGGQVLNALHVLTAAALALFFWRRPLAALVAALVVGVLSIMPAYYVSWGRYTQLTGLLLLPALAIGWQSWLHRPSWRTWGMLVLLLAGLSVIHFRVLVLTLGLMGVLGLLWSIQTPWRTLWRRAVQGAALGLAALVLVAPWLWVLVAERLAPAAADPTTLVGGGSYNALNEGLLWANTNPWLALLALLAGWFGLLRRNRGTLVWLFWLVVLLVLANPPLLGYLLPTLGLLLVLWGLLYTRLLVGLVGVGLVLLNPRLVTFHYLWLITNEVVLISLFLPFALLIGGGAALLQQQLERWLPVSRRILDYAMLVLAIGPLLVWGLIDSVEIINDATVFTTPAEAEALAWVAEHIPADARFLINTQPWFSHVDRGADAGWWLLPLTGRETLLPPVLYTYGPPDYAATVFERSRLVGEYEPGREQTIFDLIDDAGVTHIYLGPQTGPLTAATFATNERFVTLYEQDGVVILEVRP